MPGSTEVTINAAIFAYLDPQTKARRYAHRGDTIKVNDHDLKRLEAADAIAKPADEKTSENGNNDPYDEMNVGEAIAFLEDKTEDERKAYFARETANKRKGVLTHFDQPITFE